MLMTVAEAFQNFRSNLEPTKSETEDASRRQQKIRSQVEADLAVSDSFLTGSYARHTAVRPLKDVDIMVVLGEDERSYLNQAPSAVINRVADILEPHYPGRVTAQDRSVMVEFGVKVVNDISDKVVAVDVVPAFSDGSHYTIPDTRTGKWMATNPKVHQQLATSCNQDLSGHWVPMVKMIKKANSHAAELIGSKPIKPSFLLEVMAHTLIVGPWTGTVALELRAFFASAADLVNETWPDPAGLGPDVSDRLHSSPAELAAAYAWLKQTVATCDLALRQARNNQVGAALDTWQGLFGPLFTKTKST
jgi:predicted nucleotidyltransferase